MASEDPREALRGLYRDGLAKVGFDEAAVQRGLQMLESGRYVGFADVVSSLRIESSSVGVREHEVGFVVQHVTAQEARVAVTTHGARAAGRVAARRAEEAAGRDEQLRRTGRRVEDLRALLREMTSAELDGRTPLRPHIAEALREHAGYEGAPRISPRPSWVGRAPAPPSAARSQESRHDELRIVEAVATADPTDPEPVDLAETFRELGLSDEAARLAAESRG